MKLSFFPQANHNRKVGEKTTAKGAFSVQIEGEGERRDPSISSLGISLNSCKGSSQSAERSDLEMEKESRSQRASRGVPEPGLFLQWGTRKRPRCNKAPDGASSGQSHSKRRRANRRIVREAAEKGLPPPPPHHPSTLHHHHSHHHHHRKSESAGSESRSPEKEDRFYTTRGSAAAAPGCEDGGNGNGNGNGAGELKGVDLPRFFLSLSNKEKEEDFLAMKGCRLPQRPKKRAKCIQKSILLVSPGTWLMDLSQERYEVREKKSSKKKKRGLKAMFVDSDSE